MAHLTSDDIEKLSKKDSFLIQKTLYEDIKEMSIGEAKMLMTAIFAYVVDGEIANLSDPKYRFVRVAFNRFKKDYEDDSHKWLDSCKKKSDNKKEDWKKRQSEKQPNYR